MQEISLANRNGRSVETIFESIHSIRWQMQLTFFIRPGFGIFGPHFQKISQSILSRVTSQALGIGHDNWSTIAMRKIYVYLQHFNRITVEAKSFLFFGCECKLSHCATTPHAHPPSLAPNTHC